MKAKYLKSTQSHRAGDVVEIDETSLRYFQLIDSKIIEPFEAREKKVDGPKETKKPKASKK